MTVATASTAKSRSDPDPAASLAQRRLALVSQRDEQAARHAALGSTAHQIPYLASDRQILTAQLAGTRQLLAEVEAALLRISEGTYGMCGSCTAVLPADLLHVTPLVRVCSSCQHKQNR